MNINHHLDDATLMSYSAGALSQGMALVAACHLSLCEHCRERVQLCDAVGGTLLEQMPEQAVDAQMLETILGQLDQYGPEQAALHDSRADTAAELPQPLQVYLSGSLDDIAWKRIVPGVYFHDLPWQGRGVSRLLKIAPGKAMLPHTHDGNELTLVLRGAFSDEIGRFMAGDVADLDDQVEHQPLVDSEEDCICLTATDAPLRFTTLFGKLVQPMTGF